MNSTVFQLRKVMSGPNLLMWTGILVAQLVLVGLFLLDWKLPVAVILAGVVGVMAIQYPMLALGGLLAGRILATGSMSFLRIAGLNIGVFEPMLGLALAVLIIRAVDRQLSLTPEFPWRTPLLLFWGWQVLGLTWSHKPSGGFKEIVAVGVIVATTTVILVFVTDYKKFEMTVLAWILGTLLAAVLSMTTNFTDIASAGKTWEIAAQGGRETGLGQQPNWFSMNLMYGVALSFALAVVQRRTRHRIALLVIGLFILLAQLRSGSRGGTYALIIGTVVMALALPLVRKWVVRVGGLALGAGLLWAFIGDDTTSQALLRIATNVGNTWGSDIRERNWLVCLKMARDTWGIGIGAGGYQELVAEYDWKIYDSIHRYPHGIIWGVIGHYGIVGVICMGALIRQVYRMNRELVSWTQGSRAVVFTWAFPAVMTGYFAWSFVEFNFDDKPFWEFLALYTALYLVAKRVQEGEGELPPLSGGFVLPWTPRAPSLLPDVPDPVV
jgi:uncharacterized membrane protein YecN with MAPEG domain